MNARNEPTNPPEITPGDLFYHDLDEARWQRYRASRFLAVDTETRGLKTHRDRLCLVQLCNEDGLVTLVKIREQPAPRLREVLETASVLKILHFARFDLAALRQWLGIEMQPVYCTKVASRLARTYTDRHGLKDLVKELLGIEMDKEQQSSDWAADHLIPAQLAYAAADVLHLISLRERLEAMLVREGRDQLAAVCMNFLPHRAELDRQGWEEDIFHHS